MNLLAVAIWIAVLLSSLRLMVGLRRSRSSSAGPAPALHDLSEAAFVVGGPGTVVDAALVSMLGDGRLVAGGPGIVQVRPGARATDTAERAVLQAHQGAPSGWLYQLRYAAMCDPAVQEIGDGLADRGLISPPGSGLRRLRRWGLIQAVVCALLLFPVSLVLTVVSLALDSGSGVPFIAKVVVVLVGGIVVGLICASRAKSRVTGAGARALRAIRSAHLNDRTPHVQTALFGLSGLRDPHLRRQLVPAVRGTRLAAAQSRTRFHGTGGSSHGSGAEVLPIVWCAGSDGGGGGGSSCGGGSGCGSSGGSCGSSGSGCGSSGSGSSCSSGGSGCASSSSSCSSSSSSCGSSSSSSCGSSSSSSCGSSS
ncbi:MULTISPECIES: TIGR04222 domain-containing membrane protein [unclassified Streptomyces]|uniref:TIGR04222 domain-containing membrane protein n=1 Tax=unclassified Streptomyces TaxID=2593676 RepID=UPI002E119462|nr:TIGR04222 domain-containing membrane protein [Streptomyces sp. NBC_01207]WTA17923.1 TIGR04222 domain-containing membrane protein [Streptomyces sp. NBC_00853]